MFGLFKARNESFVNLSKVAVKCSLKLMVDFQPFIQQNSGFSTINTTIPFFTVAHNFVFFMVANRYGEKILHDVQKAIAESASQISEKISISTQGLVPTEKIRQVFVSELNSSRDQIFKHLEQSDRDPAAAIRGVCLQLFDMLEVSVPDDDTIEKAMEVISFCFSSAMDSLKAEYKP